MAETLCVGSDQIGEMWPHVSTWLKAATDKCGDWTIDALKHALDKDEARLWVLWDGESLKAAAVSQIAMVPRGKVCTVIACGGEAAGSWECALLPIERYAEQAGCVAFRIQGRPAWARVFKDYKTEWITIEKVLR